MQKLKINDEVVVVAGKEKGKSGKVSKILDKKNRVVVSGVNLVKKTLKPTQENPNGGIIDVEASLHRSNIMLTSPKTNKPTRVRIESKDGKKVRVAVTCGSVLE
jgi:large subunit ribosomal protein L24